MCANDSKSFSSQPVTEPPKDPVERKLILPAQARVIAQVMITRGCE
jgi:hypothetical protein